MKYIADYSSLATVLILCDCIVSVKSQFSHHFYNNINDSLDRRIIFPDSNVLTRSFASGYQGNGYYESQFQSFPSYAYRQPDPLYGYSYSNLPPHYSRQPRFPQPPPGQPGYPYYQPNYNEYQLPANHHHTSAPPPPFGPSYGDPPSPYHHGFQPQTQPHTPRSDDYWSDVEQGPRSPLSQHYRDLAAVFHDIERKWEPANYDSSAEEHDMLDDFHGRSLVAPGQYPHMAALGFFSRRSTNPNHRIIFKCGGSLISDIFILTAAHCCNDNGQTPFMVKLGDINLLQREFDIIPQRKLIAQIYIHPEYNSTLYYNDIALVRLRNPVEYTQFVRPIRLWARDDIPYQKAFTMGYGSTSFAQEPTNILTELDLTIVPGPKCNQILPPHESAPFGILESQICAKDFEKNRDTCQGDSGGPLQLNLERKRRRRRYRYYLVGIISYGEFCRSPHPGVYTRVSSYIDWIAPIVWPEHFNNF